MKLENIKTAVILCGGRGTRLGLIGKKIPKSLIKIHGYPIIWFIINILIKNSFNHFILPTGYKGKLLSKYFKKNLLYKNIKFDLVNTGIDTSIAKRIYLIKNKIKSENFLLLNGDAILDCNIKKIYEEHVQRKDNMTFIGCEAQLNFGTVGISNGKIINFEREIKFNAVNVKNKSNFSGKVYSGMSIMRKNILNINFKKSINFEKDLYPRIIKKLKCNFASLKGFWHSIDNVKDINSLNKNINLKKYKSVINIIKKIKKYEKKFLEK